VVKNLKTY